MTRTPLSAALVLVALFAVMPFTSSDSSCQLRPCSGSSSIWRRSMLPETCEEVTLTSGTCELTVTVSATPATANVTGGTVTTLPTSSSMSLISDVAKPDSSMRIVYFPGGRFSSR